MKTLVARFDNVDRGADAMGALMDHGVAPASMDLVANESYGEQLIKRKQNKYADKAKDGVTTTTAADAQEGAKSGAALGLGAGVLAGLASLVIPGYGIVLGGGALMTAAGAAVGTGVAGAATGAVTGYLRDLGIDEKVTKNLDEALKNGGGVLTITVSQQGLPGVRAILEKYHVDHLLEVSNERTTVLV